MLECCENSGGRVILTVDGERYRTRAGVTIAPTTYRKEVQANDDGTIYIMTRSKPATASFMLTDRCGLSLEKLVAACNVDVTIDLIDMKKRYLFTKAHVVGEPEISTESGEIRGLSVASTLVKELPYS